jgi:hypothetical protein
MAKNAELFLHGVYWPFVLLVLKPFQVFSHLLTGLYFLLVF